MTAHLQAKMLIFHFVFLPATLLAQSPGGVSANLQFWVKGNLGGGTVGSATTTWTDQSGNGLNAAAAGSARPTLTANQFNFNNAQVFNGTSNYMDITSNLNIAGTLPYTIYFVLKQTGANLQAFFGATTAVSSPASADLQLYSSSTGTVINEDGFAYGTFLSSTTSTQSGVPYIAGFERNGTVTNGSTIYFNLNLDNTGTIPLSLGNHNKRIGATYTSAGPTYFLNGGIAEVIIYKATMASATDRLKLRSYLGLKYGFPPPTSSNFVSSNGTIFWTDDATYKNNIFGVGRDDGSGLTQTSSNSVNTGSGNGTGQTGKGNVVLSSPSVLNNQNFIVLGNDAGALTEQATNLPASTPATVRRIGRQWKVNNNSTGTTVNFAFDGTGLTLTGTTVTDYALLIDNDGDGNFATGTVTRIPATSLVGKIVSFSAVNLPNNAIVTLVTKNQVLLPLSFTAFTARLNNAGQVALKWETANETNVDRFVVQRSTDGSNLVSIGQVNFTGSPDYAFTDENPLPGNNYYQIASTDLDGKITYSPVRLVTLPTGSLDTKLLNNLPGQDNPLIQISTANPVTLNISLFTINGSLISRTEKQFAAGETKQPIATTGLARGTYIVEINSHGYNKHFLLIR